MVATHERNYKKPIKWFALPQLFRYERQQKGRLREHFQFNADLIGETDPAADAELIALLIDTLRSFGLTEQDFVIRLSSRNAWQEFYRGSTRAPRVESGALPDSSASEYEFFQIIDKLERTPPEESQKKLAALGFALDDVNAFINSGKPTAELASIIANLAARGLREFVKVDYKVIRGLAYYTGVVFEAFDAKGEFRAIAGGGRYDNLVKLISGGKVNLPRSASAWAMSSCWNCSKRVACCQNSIRTWTFLFDRGRNPPRTVAQTHPGFARCRIRR
ncbi:MAG: ATP phosphoribosyltransferase regulatory subunit [Limisphaerales bacterium]